MTTRSHTWKRIALGGALVLVVALAIGLWLHRDGPRRLVQSALADTFGAEVRLGELEILGAHSFVLRDLEVRRPRSQPWVDFLRLPRVEVEGSPLDIRHGRVERLASQGGELRLRRPEPGEEPPPAEGEAAWVGKLTFAGLRLSLDEDGKLPPPEVAGDLSGRLDRPQGEIRLTTRQLALAPLLAFFLGERWAEIRPRTRLDLEQPYTDVAATLRLAAEEMQLAVRGTGGLAITADGHVRLPFPQIDLTLAGDRLAARVEAERLLELQLAATGVSLGAVDPTTLRLQSVDLAVARSDVLLRALGGLPPGWELAGLTRLTMAATSSGRLGYRLEAELDRLELATTGSRILAPRARLALHGEVPADLPPKNGTVTARLDLPRLDGTVGGRSLPTALAPLALHFEGTTELLGDDPLAIRLRGSTTVATAAAGELTARGAVVLPQSSTEDSVEWTWRGARLADLRSLAADLGLAMPVTSLAGAVAAQGTLRGDLTAPAIAGTLTATALAAAAEGEPPPLALTGGRLDARFQLAPDRSLRIPSFELSGQLQPGQLAARPLRLTGTATLHPGGRLEVGPVEGVVADLGRLRVRGSMAAKGDPLLSADLTFEELSVAAWRTYLQPLLGEPFPDYRVTFRPAATLHLEQPREGPWRATGEASLEDVEIASADGSRVLQGLDSRWRLNGEGDRASGQASFEATSSVGGFVLLWGGIFADYSTLVTETSLRLRLVPGSGDADPSWTAEARLQPSADLWLRAGLEQPPAGAPLRYSVDFAADDLASSFERYARGPLGGSVEALARLRASGKAGAQLWGTVGETERTVAGRVRLEDVDLGGREGVFRARGLDLDLPLDLRWSDGADDTGVASFYGDPQRGHLGFRRLAFGTVRLDAASTALVVEADRVGLEEEMTLPLLGGRIRLAALSLEDVLQPSRHVETALTVEGVRLEELSQAMGTLPLAGDLAGHFPAVSITPTRLEVQGGGEVAVFGGTVRVGDISGENVLSDLPKLRFSADFHDIDLLQLTRTFDVGEISGILEGWIRNCELFGGTPVRFSAQIETVEKKGVPQRITVKAINNLAIVGTGGPLGVLDSGLRRLLDRYAYKKLGLRMTLQNDAFLVRGIEQRGDKELFLKGKLPLRIDIVNADPGKTVSFSTMLARINNVDFEVGKPRPAPPPPDDAVDAVDAVNTVD